MSTACHPSPDQTLLGHYLQIEGASLAMLSAARRRDWPGVSDCEDAIRTLANHLDAERPQALLSPHGRRERLRILHRLVQIDAEVRRLVDPASRRLDALFAPRHHRPAPGPACRSSQPD